MSASAILTIRKVIKVGILPEDVLPAIGDEVLHTEVVRRGMALPDDTDVSVTGDHIRAARGLIDWSMADLAAASGVSVSTLKRLEDGSEGRIRPDNVAAIHAALQGEGVRFRRLGDLTCIFRIAPTPGARADAARVPV